MKKYHYVYRITNLVTNMHYYGDRSCNCLPVDDLGIKYFSSFSESWFKKDQLKNPQNYKYKIIKIFETCREDAKKLEVKLHARFDVRNHDRFINKANQTTSGFMNTPAIIEKSRLTKLLKYGSENYNNPEKIKQRWLSISLEDKYESVNRMLATRFKNGSYITGGKKSIETRLNTFEDNGNSILENAIIKCQDTKLIRYGDAYYNNPSKISSTKLGKSDEYKHQLSVKMSLIRTEKNDEGISLMDKLSAKARLKDSIPENKKARIEKSMETKWKTGKYNNNMEQTIKTKFDRGHSYKYIIYNADNIVVFEGLYTGLKKWCADNVGSFYAFEESAKKGGELLYPTKGSKKYRHLKNFRCYRVKNLV